MKKQLTVLSMALAFFACGVCAASAKTAPPTVVGTWAISGSASIKAYINHPTKPIEKLLSLDVELPNVAMVGEEFIFGTATGGTGPFGDTLLS